MGNYHAGFLRGKGAVRPLIYPVYTVSDKKDLRFGRSKQNENC